MITFTGIMNIPLLTKKIMLLSI